MAPLRSSLNTKRSRRALGQHYLIDRKIIEQMVRQAEIGRDERVLEVGTGKGVLTRELCQVSTRVEGFELDEQNYLATKRLGLEGLTLHHEDAFSIPREFDVLVSSLPYSESSNFVGWLAGLEYKRAIVLLQRDFARKLLASPGDDQYRAVSVISRISSDARIIRRVPRESFDPPPNVASVLVRISKKRRLSSEELYSIKLLFSQRRKTLAAALKSLGLEPSRVDSELILRRVETLSPDEIGRVILAEVGKNIKSMDTTETRFEI